MNPLPDAKSGQIAWGQVAESILPATAQHLKANQNLHKEPSPWHIVILPGVTVPAWADPEPGFSPWDFTVLPPIACEWGGGGQGRNRILLPSPVHHTKEIQDGLVTYFI